MMNRYVCVVSYLGAQYEGWQSQRRGNSIQEILEDTIGKIAQEHVDVIGSGRTDAGVSARGQVFMFDTNREMTPYKWMGAINGYLPKDIHIMNCWQENELFHARYNVRWKRYVYHIHMGSYDVFTKDTAYQCTEILDLEAMKQAIPYLIGTHDFTALNSSSLEEYPDQVRTIFDIQLHVNGNDIAIEFRGKGFLRYMVRMMSATLIEIGKHHEEPEYIQELLRAKTKNVRHRNAPACGLSLEEVNYFKILAMNEEIMVREFLHDDCFPEGWSLQQCEQQTMDHAIYVITERHSQKNLGYIEIESQKVTLFLNDSSNQQDVMRLEPQLQTWFLPYGIHCEITIKNI